MNKKLFFIAFIALTAGFILGRETRTSESLAKTSLSELPMGGTVVADQATLAAAIVCNAKYGPFMITPIGGSIPGPFFIPLGTTDRGTPTISKQVLGLHSRTQDTETCYNPETGAPVPAYEVTLYGTN